MFGLMTSSKGWEGFIRSNRSTPVCIAKAELNYDSPTYSRYGHNTYTDQGGCCRLGDVHITKYFNIPLIQAFNDQGYSNRRWNPSIMVFYYTSTGDGLHLYSSEPFGDYNGDWNISENATSCTIRNNLWLSTPARDCSHRRGVLRILFFANLPDNAPLPNFGFVMKNAEGRVTYNSNYMPLLLRGLGHPPSWSGRDPFRVPPVTPVSGVDGSRRPATSYGFTVGASKSVGGLSCNGAMGAYSVPRGGLISVPWSRGGNVRFYRWSEYYNRGIGYARMPIIYSDDYF